MKALLTLVTALLALNLHAGDFSVGSTSIGTNMAYAATPVGAKKISFVSAYGYNENTTSLKFFDATAAYTVTNALAASVGSNILCQIAGSSLVIGNPILIADLSAGTYQRAWVHSTNAAGIVITNIYQASNLSTQTLADGDRVYLLTERHVRKVPNNTAVTLGGTGGLVWAPSNDGMSYPTSVELLCDGTTLLTNVSVVISGEK